MKKPNILTSNQHQSIIGGLLGDLTAQLNGIHCRLTFDHSAEQLEYVRWKHNILKPYMAGEVKVTARTDNRTGKINMKAIARTLTLPDFNYYYELFYCYSQTEDKIVKKVPTNIGDLLTSELALAIWYLDDGARRTDCSGLRLHTNDFTYKEVLLLQSALLQNYQIKSKPNKQGKKKNGELSYNLAIGATENQSAKFCDIIRPIVASEIPSMLYKLL